MGQEAAIKLDGRYAESEQKFQAVVVKLENLKSACININNRVDDVVQIADELAVIERLV